MEYSSNNNSNNPRNKRSKNACDLPSTEQMVARLLEVERKAHVEGTFAGKIFVPSSYKLLFCPIQILLATINHAVETGEGGDTGECLLLKHDGVPDRETSGVRVRLVSLAVEVGGSDAVVVKSRQQAKFFWTSHDSPKGLCVRHVPVGYIGLAIYSRNELEILAHHEVERQYQIMVLGLQANQLLEKWVVCHRCHNGNIGCTFHQHVYVATASWNARQRACNSSFHPACGRCNYLPGGVCRCAKTVNEIIPEIAAEEVGIPPIVNYYPPCFIKTVRPGLIPEYLERIEELELEKGDLEFEIEELKAEKQKLKAENKSLRKIVDINKL